MASNYSKTSNLLPPPGIPTLIHEIIGNPFDSLQARSVRVVGRVVNYDAVKNLAFLMEPTQSMPSHQLIVDTSLTDSADYISGSQVMLIGELEESDNFSHQPDQAVNTGSVILRARVSRCVDRLDYPLYCKTLESWRQFIDHHFKVINQE